jgi:hypothetical protein
LQLPPKQQVVQVMNLPSLVVMLWVVQAAYAAVALNASTAAMMSFFMVTSG